MVRTISWLIILVFFISCYRNAPEPSQDMSVIIPPDSMVSLLTDIHLIEGVMGTLKEKDSVLKNISSDALNIVLNKHHLSRKAFEENIHYYTYHTESLDEIYEKVINNLGKLESEITVKKEELPDDTAHLENTAVQE